MISTECIFICHSHHFHLTIRHCPHLPRLDPDLSEVCPHQLALDLDPDASDQHRFGSVDSIPSCFGALIVEHLSVKIKNRRDEMKLN